jgi:hypothetical protein
MSSFSSKFTYPLLGKYIIKERNSHMINIRNSSTKYVDKMHLKDL